MSVILVLEDMPERVEWLQELIGDRHEIFWSESVSQFLLDLDNIKPDLVILDHDLGGVPTSIEGGTRDSQGLTGSDAVREMRHVDCPILVWSFNCYRAPQMVQTLTSRGMRARWALFGSDDCVATIVGSLLRT